MRNIRSRFVVIMVLTLSVAFGLGAGIATASTAGSTAGAAAPAAESAVPAPVEARGAASPLAWECPSGDFCVWENTGGTGRRCNWDVADPNWSSGAIVCSWADDTRVESALDNGNVARFLSVEVFRNANYGSRFACLRRGVTYNITAGGIILQSHRWATFVC
jgi:hypothetical protein